MLRLSGEALDAALAQWAARRLGFDRRALRFERLRITAEKEAVRLGWPALEQALLSGITDAALDGALVAAATVGETYFFRQHEHFDLLGELPFPGSAKGPLKAWSAACASGEEAYSLAVALRQAKGLEAPALQVWGTDINEAALVAARAANYGRWSFRASVIEAGHRDDQAELAKAEQIRQQVLDPRTRAVVRFARQSLLEAPTFDGETGPRFHLIFCRNALVYFSPEAAALAVEHLVQALLPGGWLVLGNMDIAATPEGTRRLGSAHLCVFERSSKAAPTPAAVADASASKPSAPEAPKESAATKPVIAVAPRDIDEAVDWHRGLLAQLEAGESDAVVLELQALVEAHPDYLPGWFEHGLTLNRRGQRKLAADSLKRVLVLAQGRQADAMVPGPEPLSLDFYVGNAEAFLQSQGDAP